MRDRSEWLDGSAYISKQCRLCLRDYLYPAYGGRATCHDCQWNRLDMKGRTP